MNICKTLFLNECSVVAATSEQFMRSVVVEIDSDSSDNEFYGNICSTERKIDDHTTASKAKRLNYANLQAISFLSSNKEDLDVLNEYPIIKEVFLKYNTTIPSLAPVKRLFSKAIQVLTPRQNVLNAEMDENAIGQNRLNGLALLSVHRNIKVDPEDVLHKFALQKDRAILLI
ncbi:hypothetical protein QTP88_028099 [Uroleucon formosanum]